MRSSSTFRMEAPRAGCRLDGDEVAHQEQLALVAAPPDRLQLLTDALAVTRRLAAVLAGLEQLEAFSGDPEHVLQEQLRLDTSLDAQRAVVLTEDEQVASTLVDLQLAQLLELRVALHLPAVTLGAVDDEEVGVLGCECGHGFSRG